MENKTDSRNTDVIDLRVIIKRIITRKKLFWKTLPAVFVLSCAYILCIPRYYETSLSLAPEVTSSSMQGALGSLASSFGFDLGSMETTDAISPLLYPDLMEDNKFITDLFSIKVESADGDINCNYYDYLDKFQKRAWWDKPMDLVKGLFKEKEKPVKKGGQNPYILSKKQDNMAEKVRKDISLKVDKKTGVITISVQTQDPLICKTVADSVKEQLQLYITEYRTNKARIDMEYYEKLAAEAKKEYEEARYKYGSYADANTDIVLESYKATLADMENDMQLKYNTYSTLMTQYQASKAKVQERTPAFTVVKGAAVPIKPAGPKRMLFVLGMMFIAVIFTSFYIIKDSFLSQVKLSKSQYECK